MASPFDTLKLRGPFTQSGGDKPLGASWTQTVTVVDGTAYNEIVGYYMARNGTPPYTYSKVIGDASLTINGSTGAVTYNGTAVLGANPSATFRVSDVGPDPDVDRVAIVVVSLDTLDDIVFSNPDPSIPWYPFTVSTLTTMSLSGGYEPAIYAFVGDSTGYEIVGNAINKTGQTNPGTKVLTIRATDNQGQVLDVPYSVTVEPITTLFPSTFSPASPTIEYYPYATTSAVTTVSGQGGYAPYTYVVTAPVQYEIQNTDEVWRTTQSAAGFNLITVRTTDAAGQTRTDNVAVTNSRSVISAVSWDPASPTINPAAAPVLASTATPTGGYGPYTLASISLAEYNNPTGTELWLNSSRPAGIDTVNCDVVDITGNSFATSINVEVAAALQVVYTQTQTVYDQTAYADVVATYVASGGLAPYVYSKVSGDIELTIDSGTGDITYTGTAVFGTNPSATFRVTDQFSDQVDQLCTVTVDALPITAITFDPASPTTTANSPSPELVTVMTATGGTGTVTYTIVNVTVI